MDYDPEIPFKKSGRIDTVKLGFFEDFIALANERGITMVCSVSPSYKPQTDTSYYAPIQQLCDKYNIVFLNNGEDSDISNNKGFFQDASHMNDIGASIFTSKLAKCIKSNLNS